MKESRRCRPAEQRKWMLSETRDPCNSWGLDFCLALHRLGDTFKIPGF